MVVVFSFWALLSGISIFLLVTQAMVAPEGWQDARGFHFVRH